MLPVRLSSPAALRRPRVVVDIETLLLDVTAGMRQALLGLARHYHRRMPAELMTADLRARSLNSLIAAIAGSHEVALIAEMSEHYWRIYDGEWRFRAPVRQGAPLLKTALVRHADGVHYLSNLGSEASARMIEACGMRNRVTATHTPPLAVCPCARGRLLQDFLRDSGRPASDFLLLGGHPFELQAARRLGMPALGLGFDPAMRSLLEAQPGSIDVAASLGEVGGWLEAARLAREQLQRGTRLH